VRYRRGGENIADFLSRQGDVVSAVSTRNAGGSVEVDYEALDKIREKMKRRRRARSSDADAHGMEKPAKRAELGQNERPKAAPTAADRKKGLSEDVAKLIIEQGEDSHIMKLWDIAKYRALFEPTYQELQDASDLFMRDGVILKRIVRKSGETQDRIVVPLASQKRVVREVHKTNHSGVKGTLAILTRWFRSMKALVKQIVRHCPECIARKGRPLRRETLAPDERPAALGGRWHIDGLQLPGNYDHLMVAVDAATKYVILRPSDGETAREPQDSS